MTRTASRRTGLPTAALTVAALTMALILIAAAPSRAQEAGPLAVPGANAAAAQSLPPRPLPDLTKPLDLGADFTAATALFTQFAAADPALDDRVLDLNLDPEAAFALIRDQVQSLPYEGHLRSPADVLSAGAGNAYDKALALSDLLGRMGYDTQLVVGPNPSPDPAQITCGSGTVPPEVWQLTRLGPAVLARVPLRAQASYAQLVSHLTPADGDAPATAATAPHVWVQMRDGTDWVDLDPWSPATAYGDHPAGQGTLMGDPPEAASVTLTLSVETMTAEAELSTDTILSATLDMPDAADTVVALYFGPDLSGTGAGVVGVLNAINGQAGTMAAYLTINGDTQKSSAFPLPGPVTAAADGFFADGTAALTTAMTLRVTSHVPGQADHVETRPILDLIPPALRLPGAAAPTLADLLPVTPGQQYPAALESLRSILISNGGTPRRHLAASEAMQIVGLYQRMQRDDPDFATIYDAVWTSALEAGRVQFAAEELIRARPAHDGACATIDRPRVMIAGVGTASQGRILRWLDWVIDDVTLRGGNATAQAEARLWHGAMQAALEKEALMQQIMLPDDAVPLDSAAMQPMDAARLVATGPEAADDAAKDYTVLTAADLAPDSWWRLDPVTGQADARVRLWGNGFWNYTNSTPNTGPRISVPRDPRIANLEGDAIWRRILADEARRKAAAAAAQPKCGGNEYLILATCVSIPGSIAVGLLVGTITVYGVYSYATAGP